MTKPRMMAAASRPPTGPEKPIIVSDGDTQRLGDIFIGVLAGVDNEAIVRHVVNKIDREYSPMDESFDSPLAARAAYMALDRLVEVIKGPDSTGGER